MTHTLDLSTQYLCYNQIILSFFLSSRLYFFLHRYKIIYYYYLIFVSDLFRTAYRNRITHGDKKSEKL